MYNISTICFGNKYTPIREHWEKKMKETCITSSGIYIWDQTNIKQNENFRVYVTKTVDKKLGKPHNDCIKTEDKTYRQEIYI